MEYDILKEIDPVRSEIAKKIHPIFAAKKTSEEISEIEIFRMLEKPPESTLGDYAFPCFRFAKLLRQSPQKIAELLRDELQQNGLGSWIADIKVVGAFLNFFTNKKHFVQDLLPKVLGATFFQLPKTHQNFSKTRVMIEFSQPNTHKEFHVGHARNVCLGDALCRLYTYLGYDVIAANYIGDEGTHVAKCLWQVLEHGSLAPDEEKAKSSWYGAFYVAATKLLEKADPTQKKIYEQKISSILADLEAKRGQAYDFWQKSRAHCLDDFKATYSWLDVNFDHYFFESEVSEEAQSIVDEFIKKGLFKESEGAIGIDLEEFKLGFFMARKSDGSTPYITKDLALARRKFEDFKIDRSIYVVACEQNFHFQQLFKALDLMGFPQAKDCFHLSYAHVKLPEGKMSSRQGNVLPFSLLRDRVVEELLVFLEKYKGQWTEEEIANTAHCLAIGAIKYGMLSADPVKEIIFDLKAWTAFEGNTGPYLMYSYARTRSILAKAHEKNFQSSLDHLDRIQNPFAMELLRTIYDFNDVVKTAGEHYKPSILANALYDMCKIFNRFYVEVSILKADSDEERSALLALLEAYATTLKKGLFLLGITPPERM